MNQERLSMRTAREILRQKWELKKSHREVAQSLGISAGSVGNVVFYAKQAGLDWEKVQSLDDLSVRRALGEVRAQRRGSSGHTEKPMPDCAYIHTERRKPGVTLELLHHEYLERNPDGYQYSQYCEIYRQWLKGRGLTMRQEHRGGEKVFVDYSGKKPHFIDPQTGEPIEVELFVAVWGASNYTYAEATRSQKSQDWIASHKRALAYFGGVPGALVPDQLKSGVTRSCRYEPGIHHVYEEFATHYDTVVLPARPAKSRDKAKVEVGVQIVQRWILARLRNQTFFSLDELNERMGELLEELNQRPMRVYRASRRELFEKLDRPAMKALPQAPFVYGEWKRAKVHIDYHVEADGHYYSAHYSLVGEEIEIRMTATTVELYLHGQRHASHARSDARGQFTTLPDHRPKSHQRHAEWTPGRILNWARSVGPKTQELAEAILKDRPHPEMGYRSCLGILRLSKQYGQNRLEAACEQALAVGARSYRHVASILKNGLDTVARSPVVSTGPISHENIRGPNYYH